MGVKSYTVSRADLGKVYEVACDAWKEKIEAMVEEYSGIFSETLSIPADKVYEMFMAATPLQRELLVEVFPTFTVDDDIAILILRTI